MKPLTLKMAMNREVECRVVNPGNSSSRSRGDGGTSNNRRARRCGGVDSSIIHSMVVVGSRWSSKLEDAGTGMVEASRLLLSTKKNVSPPLITPMRDITDFLVQFVGMM